ncbi:hypothetical protein Gogos_003162, partial [Gossypium gossypioides]|nr:hypothetical protein [Gossypium gossypioides]
MTKGVDDHIELRETCGGRKANKSRGMLSALEGRLSKLEGSMMISNLDAMKGVFNTIVNNLIEKADALEAMVTAWKEQIGELKGELIVYKVALGNRMLASAPKQCKMNFPKLNEFKETRSTRDVDNFLGEWHCMPIDEKRGDTTFGTWEEFQKDELVLQISNLSEKEEFYYFEDRL